MSLLIKEMIPFRYADYLSMIEYIRKKIRINEMSAIFMRKLIIIMKYYGCNRIKNKNRSFEKNQIQMKHICFNSKEWKKSIHIHQSSRYAHSSIHLVILIKCEANSRKNAYLPYKTDWISL